MFGMERLQAIKEIVYDQESVEVANLSNILGVSEMTIRRDLDKLEKEGLVIKTYGGAVLKKDKPFEVVDLKDDSKNDLHKKIAKTASELIEDGEVLFIAGGSITTELCELLKTKKGLVVVTNNIHIARNVMAHRDNKVIVTAGEVNPTTGDINGFESIQTLSSFLVQKAFIGIDGIDSDLGYTTNNKEYVHIFNVLQKISNRIILVADHNQYGKRGLVRVANLEDIKEIVTDKKIPSDFKEFYFNNDIKIYASMVENR